MLLALLLLLSPSPTLAQATARGLEVVASDGTVVRVGEVTGDIEVEPSADPAARFGRVIVRAGLVLEARATSESAIPVWVRGRVGPIAARRHAARIDALHVDAEGRIVARVVLGDVTLSDVPIRPAHWEVAGSAPVAASGHWRAAPTSFVGTTAIFDGPVGSSVTFTSGVPIPFRVIGRRGRWQHVRAVSSLATIEGWMREPELVPSEPMSEWIDGEMGAISGACSSEGEPTLVAADTPVHLSVGGPVWARTPAERTRLWIRDDGGPWVEIHFTEGIQRAWPDSTCSLGWIPREALVRRD